MCRRQPHVWSDVRGTRRRRRWPASGRRGASGLQRRRWWMRSSRGSGAVAAVSADAGDGESRSGSASRSDSLIEFVKTNVAILPLLILRTELRGLNDTAVDGFWIGSNWESTGDAPLADTLASIMHSAPYDGAAACAEAGGVINCK
jgi:hypothetical protein